MPTNAELEAMCEQAFPRRMIKVRGLVGDANSDPRSKALALAMEVRDKTQRETVNRCAKVAEDDVKGKIGGIVQAGSESRER